MKISPFETKDALEFNKARGNFLKSFLPELIQRESMTTALDVGCGALGVFSRILKDLGLQVVAFDGRPENVAKAKRLNPDIEFKVQDIENPSVLRLGSFDLVLCFGLLYHVENPFRAIRNLFALTNKYLLIETMIAPYRSSIAGLYEESQSINQGLNYVAFIATESTYIKMLYKAGFQVYSPDKLPEHKDFYKSLTTKKKRTILLASKIRNDSVINMAKVKFRKEPEPEVPFSSPHVWNTILGKLVNTLREPQIFGLQLSNWLSKCIPSSLILKACIFWTKKPQPLRPYPGWVLGAGQSEIRFSTLIRRILWRQFSCRCLNNTFILKWHNGIKILAYPKDETCRSLFVTGLYEPNEFFFLKKILKPGKVFVDIGAHIGLYTLFASKYVGEKGYVLAIEPSPREFQRLSEHIRINETKNVRLIKAALSNSCGERELLLAEETHSGHNTLGYFAYTGVQAQEKQYVRVERLDDLIQREGLNRVDVIKIDVKGHEFFVLEGAKETISKFRPVLLVKLNDNALFHQGCHSSQVLDLLRQLGYQIYLFSRQTGMPVVLNEKPNYFEENILALHESFEEKYGNP